MKKFLTTFQNILISCCALCCFTGNTFANETCDINHPETCAENTRSSQLGRSCTERNAVNDLCNAGNHSIEGRCRMLSSTRKGKAQLTCAATKCEDGYLLWLDKNGNSRGICHSVGHAKTLCSTKCQGCPTGQECAPWIVDTPILKINGKNPLSKPNGAYKECHCAAIETQEQSTNNVIVNEKTTDESSETETSSTNFDNNHNEPEKNEPEQQITQAEITPAATAPNVESNAAAESKPNTTNANNSQTEEGNTSAAQNTNTDSNASDTQSSDGTSENSPEPEANISTGTTNQNSESPVTTTENGIQNSNQTNPPQNNSNTQTNEDKSKALLDKQAEFETAHDTEQSRENRLLTAAATAATGIGGMELAQGLSEQRADKDAEQNMAAYISTMRCEYGNGKSIKASAEKIELPGGNDGNLMKYRNEYFTLANDLKIRKEALGMKPGIESEEILDKSQMGLYDDENIGITDGTYASLYRAQMLDSEKDKQEIEATKQTSKNRVIGGGAAAGVGTVGGIIGDQMINGKFGKNIKSKESQEKMKILEEKTKSINIEAGANFETALQNYMKTYQSQKL